MTMVPKTAPDAALNGVPQDTLADHFNGHRQTFLWVLQGCGFGLLIAALVATVILARRSAEADAWVSHTLEVRRASGVLFSDVQEAEASVRAFLLLGDRGTLARYAAARDMVPAAEARLRVLTDDNTTQDTRLDTLFPLIVQRLSVLADTVGIAEHADQQALAERMRSRNGAQLMTQIRDQLAAFDQAEADLLAARETDAQRARQHLLIGSSAALTLTLLLGGITTILGQRQTRALHAANAQLAETISDRTGALRRSEIRFRQVFHDSPIGLTISTAATGRIVAANPAVCRMFGYTEADFIGRARSELVHLDDANISVPVQSEASPIWRPTEQRYVTKSGKVLCARVSIVPLTLPGENEPLVLATTEDITHEREVEAALRNSETRLRLVVDAAGLGVCETDLRRGVTRIDAQAATLLGDNVPADVDLRLDGPELTAWRTHIHPDDTPSHEQFLHAMRHDANDRLTVDFRMRRHDGSWAWLSAISNVVEREPYTGLPLRMLTTLQDITQRQEIETQLRHAQRMESLGQLTGGIAHDFNNLLGAILGHAEFLLERQPDRSEEYEFAREIIDCTLSGAALTQRLLAFARRQSLQPAVIDLNEYLPVHVSLLQRTIGGAVHVTVALAPGLWLTHADPSQIVDVLLNLAINARDAMPHGGNLTIAVANAVVDGDYCARHPDATEGDYVVLSVSDTGIGMTPEVQARAAEPFFTTKPPGKGSGLGLSTIYGFARQSGGHLDIESEPGRGTTVRVYLPRSHAQPGQAPARHETVAIPGGTEAILLVDDNEAMRTTTARNLVGMGYRVRLAEDGPAALAILAQEQFNLLFTDVVMPNGLSGYQLADAARAMQPNLRVLFTSGFAPDEESTSEMNAKVLRKPYLRQALAMQVRAALNGPA